MKEKRQKPKEKPAQDAILEKAARSGTCADGFPNPSCLDQVRDSDNTMDDDIRQSLLKSRRPLIIAALVVLVAVLGGLWLYRTERQHLRAIVETDLRTIARLKADQIAAWRTERLGDAAILMESPFFVEEASRWLANPSDAGREHLIARFRSLCEHYGYSDVLLLDNCWQVRLRLNGKALVPHAETMNVLATSVAERRPVLSDLHTGGTNQHPHVDVAAPLFARNKPTPEAFGAVILQVNAEQFLYPMIQSWPTYSQTAETLLVTQDQDTVLFLNDLRHQRKAALRLRIPLTQSNVPAVMAVKGWRGVVRGRDYRGIEVFAALQGIPDSPWFMIAKEDVDEAFAIQQSQSALIFLVVLLVTAMAAVSVGVIWQRSQKTHYQSLLKAEQATRESENKYRSLFEGSRDAIMILEPPSWTFTSGNAAAVGLFAAETEAQFLACQLWALSPEQQPDGRRSADKALEMLETALREGSHFFEWTHKRLNGEDFCATVLLSKIEQSGRVFLQATLRDVTDAKKAEQQIREHAQAKSVLNGLLSLSLDDCTTEEVLERALDQMVALPWFPASQGVVFLADDKQQTLTMIAHRGLPASILTCCAQVPLDRCLCGQAAASRQSEFVDCVDERHENTFDGMGPHGHYVVPIQYAARLLGVINMYVEEGHERRVEAMEFLDAAASVLGGIIHRKEVEHELRWKTAFLEAQVNSSLDGILVVDSQRRRLLTNSQIARQWDVPQHVLDDPDDAPLLNHVVSLAKYPDQFLAKVEYLYDHPTETSRDEIEFKNGMVLDRYSSPVVDKEGRYYGRVWTFHDVTSRRRAEQVTRSRLSLLMAAGERSLDEIMRLTLDEIESLTGSSIGFYHFLDADQETLTLQTWSTNTLEKMCSAEGKGQHYSISDAGIWVDCVRQRQPVIHNDYTSEPHRKGLPAGHAPIVREMTLPIMRGQQIVAVIGVGNKAVDYNNLDIETAALLGDFSWEVIERKRAEEKQIELLHQLAAINEELKQFAYVVSHDLKAPLRAIRTLSDWLIADYKDQLDSQGLENLQLLGNRVDRMANLIDGVLQYSRAGRMEQVETPIDLNELVQEIINSLDVPEHIAIRVDNELPTVTGDVTRITQVFQNLLSNAIKYMDTPQGEVAVGCTEQDGYWRFSVSDNGPGIEEKHYEKIFQLFQTLASRDTCESTGVGLAIIKKVVEMYGGRVWIQSQIGEGSTFYFTLPRTRPDVSHTHRAVLAAE